MNELLTLEQDKFVTEITEYDNKMLTVLNYLGLPTENILTSVVERKKVYKNIEDVIILLDETQRKNATYISKFFAAVGSGLFDAALNYLWDETIIQLRTRVSQYDIQYFFDLAVTSNKRSKLSTVEDLKKVDDIELITGAKGIGLISDIGFKHLEYINYMRNWASAAHPNQSKITGVQLISWLETCINEVIQLPLTNVTIEINKLLKNIKEQSLSLSDASQISSFFLELDEERVKSLANGFFGIFTRVDTEQHVRQNIVLLMEKLWKLVSEETKNGFGIKYAQFIANSDNEQSKLARSFLEAFKGESYIPEGIRSAEVVEILDNLKSINRNMNNFYSEPVFAKQLERLVGSNGVPKVCMHQYVETLVFVFLTNGNGVAWNAETYYLSLITRFSQKESMIAVLSFRQEDIASKLQFDLCKSKFLEMISIVEKNITSSAFKDLISEIKMRKTLFDLRHDAKLKDKIDTLRQMLK